MVRGKYVHRHLLCLELPVDHKRVRSIVVKLDDTLLSQAIPRVWSRSPCRIRFPPKRDEATSDNPRLAKTNCMSFLSTWSTHGTKPIPMEHVIHTSEPRFKDYFCSITCTSIAAPFAILWSKLLKPSSGEYYPPNGSNSDLLTIHMSFTSYHDIVNKLQNNKSYDLL